MVRNWKKALICLLLAASYILPGGLSVMAEDLSERPLKDKYTQGSAQSGQDTLDDIPNYIEILEDYQQKAKDYTGEKLSFGVDRIRSASSDLAQWIKPVGQPEKQALVWEDEQLSWIEWEVEVPETALYNVSFTYYAHNDVLLEPSRELYIDGKIPYQEISNISFLLSWKEKNEPIINNVNDEIVPTEIEDKKWHDAPVYDQEGYYSEPLRLYLEKGVHKFRMQYVAQPISIAEVSLSAPPVYRSYADVLSEYRAKGYQNASKPIDFQAEDHVSDKNDSALHRVPNTDPRSVPYEAGYTRLNAIGDLYWEDGGQKIEWTFEVEENGLYRIDLRVGNWFNQDLPVYRRIEIDGEVPFQEFLQYSFPYHKDWKYRSLETESGDPYLFYFEKGSHKISMTTVLAEYAGVILSLYEDTDALTELLLDITMITGTNPDVNYEYDIEKKIKDIKPRIKSIIDSIDRKVEILRRLSGGKEVASINTLLQAKVDLEVYYEDPELISKKLNDLSTMQDNFTTWYTSFQSQPLIIDYFVINSPDAPVKNATSNFWEKFTATVRNFLVSFVKDYDSIGKVEDGDEKTVLDVWVSMGTETADILKNLADSEFTPATDIAVNISILPAGQMNTGALNSLQLAIISGKAPDVALGVGPGMPVELGIRGIAVDMSNLKGFEDVKKNYIEQCFNANTFNNGVYGIPERMDFRVMFYRTDILQTLGVSIPDTWEEMIDKVLPALNQNQMSLFLPQDYTMFLFQNGGEYFSENGLECELDSAEAYQAFDQYTEMFTNYGVPVTNQFFNRFRVGTLPIGVGGIAEYLSLLNGAPEILGKWKIALIPGVKQADGSIDRSHGSTVTSSSMMLVSEKEKESWEFMKWWTSADIQVRFAQSVEARINVGSRVNSANVEAFKSLPWISEDLDVIVDSFDGVKEAKGVLGGYYMARHITNAFTRIVVEKQRISTRDSLETAIESINKEMQTYQEAYPNLAKAAGELS